MIYDTKISYSSIDRTNNWENIYLTSHSMISILLIIAYFYFDKINNYIDTSVTIALLSIYIVIILYFAPIVRIYSDYSSISIYYGSVAQKLIKISRNSIVSVGTLPYPIKYYFPNIFSLSRIRNRLGWLGVVGDRNKRPLVIITTNNKYLISCVDPDKTAVALQEIFNLPENYAELLDQTKDMQT